MDRLVLISAWNDSGGGFTHRLFDGHPEAAVWPFELQLGTAARNDGYKHQFHAKYRWPFFADTNAPAAELFDAIIEDELKSVLVEGDAAKHAHFNVAVDIDAWRSGFSALLKPAPSRADIVMAYMKSFFALWQGRQDSGQEKAMLGHCPCLILDGDEIIADFPNAKILNIVRDPRAGFADFRRRRPEMTLTRYATRWNQVTSVALHAARKWPSQVMILRLEEIIADREDALRRACDHVGLAFADTMMTPTWNGEALAEDAMGPFGGVPTIGAAHEEAAIASLTPAEAAQVTALTSGVMALLDAR